MMYSRLHIAGIPVREMAAAVWWVALARITASLVEYLERHMAED
jgi:hypothetical protein